MNSKNNPLAYCLKCKVKFPDDRAGLCPECYKEIFDNREKYLCKKCGLVGLVNKKRCCFCSHLSKKTKEEGKNGFPDPISARCYLCKERI